MHPAEFEAAAPRFGPQGGPRGAVRLQRIPGHKPRRSLSARGREFLAPPLPGFPISATRARGGTVGFRCVGVGVIRPAPGAFKPQPWPRRCRLQTLQFTDCSLQFVPRKVRPYGNRGVDAGP